VENDFFGHVIPTLFDGCIHYVFITRLTWEPVKLS